jgi:hypothetical protein
MLLTPIRCIHERIREGLPLLQGPYVGATARENEGVVMLAIGPIQGF